jgi:outer membrane biosynthesis protein TonB
MSLEAAIQQLIEAVQENTRVVRTSFSAVPSGQADVRQPARGKPAAKPAAAVAEEPEVEEPEVEEPEVEEPEVEEPAKPEKKAAAKPEKKAAAKPEKVEHPTEADLIAAFTQYLPKDLSKAEREARAPKVRAFLETQGAQRATDLKPEQRAEAITFVEGLVAELTDDAGDSDMI